MQSLTRRGLLAAGAALALADVVPAAAATDDDLVLLRLAASAELVLTAFHYRARATELLRGHEAAEFRAAQNAHGTHYRALARAIGPDAPVSADFELTFPGLTRRDRVFALRRTLERALVGVYVTAASRLSTPELRATAAAAGASAAVWAAPLPAFPKALDEEAAATVFAPYWG